MKRVLFLYTEIAGYFLACAKELATRNVEVHIIHWPINSEAPFVIEPIENVTFHKRSSLNESLMNEINPDLIVCSGWIDKTYLKFCEKYVKKINTVLTLDNHWKGSLKQRLAQILSPIALRNKFSHAWVPGEPQSLYAKKLGFKASEIKTGFYCADTKAFEQVFKTSSDSKRKKFPKNFLYLGRYVRHKGIEDMWNAFIEFYESGNKDWRLICIGTGDLFDSRQEHEAIEHLGFMQPEQLISKLPDYGIFVLPSLFEPWGVVIHELASAGMPIICTDVVGAATTFVKDGENGLIYDAGNVQALKECFHRMSEKSTTELYEMGVSSHEYSQRISMEQWSNTVLDFIEV